MHRVVPELIIDNYRKGCYGGQFEAVGLFLDLSGFSTMTDTLMQRGQHGAEVLAGMMHSVFDPLVESILNYGGEIIGFAGDGVMALYPVETDSKIVVLRALASASEIQQRLEANPARQTIYGKFQFSVKIGLTVGRVTWGILRSKDGEKATYFFRGTAVDESSDAEHQARAGEIVMTDALRLLVQDAIQTRPLDSFHRFVRFLVELPPPAPIIFPPVDLEIASIFMPEAVIASDMRGEFRQIVNLFMRYPELPNEKLEEFLYSIFDLQKKYGGLISRLDFGDKGCNMLVLWGAPVTHENDIGRALNFILELQSRVDFLITTGITYYVAHAGYLGSVMYEDYTCYGWGINLASRFMMTAPPGQIWVDDRIARHVSARFEIETIGTQRFKGFSAEQRVHVLHGRKPEAELIYQGELIGREKEMARLEELTQPLWQGEFAGLIQVLGEAGMGKGRLVYEFRQSALFEKNKALWALCQSDQILRQSFNPFRSWLFHYFGFSSANTYDERKQLFESKLQNLIDATSNVELTQELERLRSLLGALVDLFWEDSLYEQLDAEGRYNSTLLALTTFIKAESLKQPLILFLEDAEYMDDDTRNFLPRLKRALLAGKESYPVAIIASTRMEGSRLLDDDLIDARIDLNGLTIEEVARQIEILLGGVPAVELVRRVMERSEGNPYFVEQFIRYMQDENLIEISKLGWNQVRGVRDFFLPGDIGALLVARLDQLNHQVKNVVQTASVLGREFSIEVLAQISNESDDIEQHIHHAEQHGIWARKSEDRWLFTHGLLRDAAYAMQMRARRQELHRLALNAFEQLYSDDIRFHYAELAYHAESAELQAKTQHYYSLAAKVAADTFRNTEAIDYFTRALAFTPLEHVNTQFDLLIERVELFNRVGNRTAQLKDLEALEKLAEQIGDHRLLAKAKMLRAQYCFITGDYPATIQNSEDVLAISNDIGDVDLALGVYIVWSHSLFRSGKPDAALKRATDGLHLARQAGRRVEEGRALSSIGMIALESKEPAVAHAYLEDAVAIARETKQKTLESRTIANLANSAAYVQRDYPAARIYYERAYELSVELGDRYQQGLSLGNIGWVCAMLGDFTRAKACHEQALFIAREIGNLYHETYTLLNLSGVEEVQGNAQDAVGYALRANELCREKGDKQSEAWSCLYLGHAYQASGQLQEAKLAFETSLNLRRELGQPALETEPKAGLIQVALVMNDIAGARNWMEDLMRYLLEGGTLEGTEEPLRVYLACCSVLESIKDPRFMQMLTKAMALLEAQVSKIEGEQARRMFIENVPWRRTIEQAWLAQRKKL